MYFLCLIPLVMDVTHGMHSRRLFSVDPDSQQRVQKLRFEFCSLRLSNVGCMTVLSC